MQNKHLDHLEDTLLLQGNKGISEILMYLNRIMQWLEGKRDDTRITIKYDGSPAVTFGIHPNNGEFFVSTKSLFNKKSKYAFDKKQIEEQFTPGIHGKLWMLLDTFLTTVYPTGVWQGDILYTKDSPDFEETETYYRFRFNTLVYKVRKDSAMGEEIKKSPIGLVVHTHYDYQDGQYNASCAHDFVSMGNIIWQPPLEAFKQVAPAKKIISLKADIEDLQKNASGLIDFYEIINTMFSNPKKWQIEILKAINYHIIHQLDVTNFKKVWQHIHMTMWSEYISKVSFDNTDPLNGCNQIDLLESTYMPEINRWFTWYIDVMKLKNKIINVLQSMVDHPDMSLELDGKKAHHEGFVVSDTRNGKIVKLVNRKVFSHANFTLEKNWS